MCNDQKGRVEPQSKSNLTKTIYETPPMVDSSRVLNTMDHIEAKPFSAIVAPKNGNKSSIDKTKKGVTGYRDPQEKTQRVKTQMINRETQANLCPELDDKIKLQQIDIHLFAQKLV